MGPGSNLPSFCKKLFLFYLIGLSLFSFYRIYFLFQAQLVDSITAPGLIQTLWSGMQSDSVATASILIIPGIYHLITEWFDVRRPAMHQRIISAVVFVSTAYSAAVCFADFGYYKYFGLRLSTAVFTLTSSASIAARMILSEYAAYILGYVLFLIFLWKGVYAASEKFDERMIRLRDFPFRRSASITVFSLFLLIESVQGFSWSRVFRLGDGDAFATPSAGLNLISINPVRSFSRELWRAAVKGESRIQLMPDSQAVKLANSYLNSGRIEPLQPPVRTITSGSAPIPYNVVIILMESMAAANMRSVDPNGMGLRFLDSLAGQSILFDRFYSAGIHTYNGVFSTLYGLPALLKRHPMNSSEAMQPHAGLSSLLKERNYQNLFFSPHDKSFDNLGGFLSANGFDRVISATDFSHITSVNMWGTDDHQLMDLVADYLDTIPHDRPFLSVVLTASNHRPFKLPKSYMTNSKQPSRKDVLKFSDQALEDFFDRIKHTPWFERTLFVLLGDHGVPEGSTPIIDLGYHHVPLLIRLPGTETQGCKISSPAGQIDVTPTIMGLLGGDYINRTLGIDLLREERPFIFFSADDKIGCISEDHVFISDIKKEALIGYRSKKPCDNISTQSLLAEEMRNYAFSMIQTSQWMITHKKLVSN